ncbi:PKD domain-containing protein [Micromonospora sp. NPDC023966]|uniref:PKD domain-containing protein n=1 Tax=Micromonospora sp. NPDC023966 TaxID=3154699 RepID=UPI0033E5EB17
MRKSSLAGLTALAMTGGTLLATSAPAHAAEGETLYVRQLSSACSDQGPGTQAQPFCTIGAAAAAVTDGQWVDVGAGNYRERVTITSSGTESMPIVFFASASAVLIGPDAGFVIDGQHDVTLQNLRANGGGDLPALDIRNSSGIQVQGGGYAMADGATAPAVRLAGVTSSALKQFTVTVRGRANGLAMDAASTDVYVWDTDVTSSASSTEDQSVGIQVAGSRNTVLGNRVSGFTGTAVAVEPGASGALVVNNQIDGGPGHGIHNRGATGTAITNNTVRERCLDGIRVDGASTGVSVQNNVLTTNGAVGPGSCSSGTGVELGVYGDAVRDVVVDYNNADHYESASPRIYAWNGTRMSLPAFRTASGQAAHDRETANVRDAFDSANSTAPGYQPLDRIGRERIDDPAVPNTGAGPVTYADRGAVETIRSPVARTDVRLDLTASSVTVDASASEPGTYPPITSYQFSFGDGTTVTQTSPVVSHRYANPGEYTISTKVIGTDGRSGTRTDFVSVLRRTATVGLLAVSNLRYVAPSSTGPSLQANQLGLTAAGQFDLADAGSGAVAIVSRATGRYVAAATIGAGVTTASLKVGDPEKFTVVRNTDGSVSIKSLATYRYLGAASTYSFHLMPQATTIGTAEKFYRVIATDAGRSLKAGANSRFVTADSAGATPLIANSTSVGTGQRFDLVDLGNGQIGIFARANNLFVCADGTGTKPLIANRTSVGAWEKFTLIRNTDGTVSLKAAVNSRYVTAESGGAKPLIANRTAIGPWEKFTLGS